jgi:hypothetical protein
VVNTLQVKRRRSRNSENVSKSEVEGESGSTVKKIETHPGNELERLAEGVLAIRIGRFRRVRGSVQPSCGRKKKRWKWEGDKRKREKG